jgi:uncharacterized protein
MVIGLLTVELRFPENGSLKEKRMVLRRLLERLKQRFNVSVAEVDHQDLWQRATLAVATVNTSGREADSTLAHALDLIDAYHEAEVLGHQIEMR